LDMKNVYRICQLLVLTCVMLGGLVSCGSDEPDVDNINYYIEVEEEFLVNGTTQYTDRYKEHNPIAMMKEAVRTAYPTPDDVGKDEAVAQACDQVRDWFYDAYSGNGDHLTCLVHLVKIHKQGDYIKSSERLRSYNIDVNPITPAGE